MKLASNRLVLDSWALLSTFYVEQPACETVEQMLLDASKGKVLLWLSSINLGEIYYSVGRRRSLQAANDTISRLRQMPITIDPVDEEIVLQAASYKMRYPISYADAFAVTTAVQHDARLVTGDPELIALSDIVSIEPLQRHP